MPRFFVENEAICADRITISGEDARHISHSLRMKPGEKLTVCGPDGTEYLCAAEHFSAGRGLPRYSVPRSLGKRAAVPRDGVSVSGPRRAV